MALLLACLVCSLSAGATVFDRNLAYLSPYADHPEMSHNIDELQARHFQNVRRQTADAAPFSDNHYPTFYGSDFSNSPFVWNGGINFTHSVASGDPLDTSVLVWTRAFPLGAGPDQSVPVCVSYKIFTTPGLEDKPVDSAQAFTTWDVDFTVKFEIFNLEPDTHYFYLFSDCTNESTRSPIGKTRTLPSPDTPAASVNGGKPLTLAVFSCSQFQTGYFNAYAVATHNTSADLFVHLGDYASLINKSRLPIGRDVMGRELATIHDYRQRFNQYRTDASLLAAHLNAPWITVADNSWKAGTTNSNDTAAGCSFSPSGACFTDRKLAAVRAYHEWLPVRQISRFDQLRIWRNFQIGKLLDLTMLDTRVTYVHPSQLTIQSHSLTVVASLATFANRSLMGAAQEKWFQDTLTQSQDRGAVWRIVGQQIVFTQLLLSGAFVDLDDWDGYRANRQRVLDHLYKNKISNTIILSGDSHANWVSDLAHPNDTATYNPSTGDGAIGVEFAGTAVTSPSPFGTNAPPAVADPISSVFVASNADLQWSEGSFRGFFTLTIDPKTVTATYYAMNDISHYNLAHFVSAEFFVEAGANRLTRPVAGGKVAAGALKSNGTA
ncbi:PhoD-like phosphatase-domain-containing protein [Mycena vitilis]|nr:PhoD-like phosphatase-domain-containing protein [Mycena vitilis]